jgi:hypothetical protein
MTDESAAPKSDGRFWKGRPKTGGRVKGAPSKLVSVKRVEQRILRQIDRALSRHEQCIDQIFARNRVEALKVDAAMNRTVVQLLELLQQRRGSSEGGAPASNTRMSPREIEAAAHRAAEAGAPVSDLDAMGAYLAMVNGRDDDALQVEIRRNELARAAAAPSGAERQIPPSANGSQIAEQSEALGERGYIPADDTREQPEADPPPPAQVIDVPLPDGPPVDWDDPHLTVVMATPVRRA